MDNDVYAGDSNRFSSYKLDVTQVEQGHNFSHEQIMVIKNYIAAHAHDHLNIRYDAAQPHLAAIQQSYINGAIEALEQLLNGHEAVQQAAIEREEQQHSQQY